MIAVAAPGHGIAPGTVSGRARGIDRHARAGVATGAGRGSCSAAVECRHGARLPPRGPDRREADAIGRRARAVRSADASLPMNATVPLTLSLALLFGGCGGGASDAMPDAGTIPSGPPVDPIALPAPLLALRSDPARIGTVPEIVLIETVASSGIQIAYTEEAQRARIDPLVVAGQWEAIQGCVGIVAPAPLVIVVGDEIDPFFSTDDVLRDIDLRITAGAGAGADGVPVIQVRDSVFGAAGGDPGFPLRWIMSRYLWASADLPERDIPYLCARRESAARP